MKSIWKYLFDKSGGQQIVPALALESAKKTESIFNPRCSTSTVDLLAIAHRITVLRSFAFICLYAFLVFFSNSANAQRRDILLDKDWFSRATDSLQEGYEAFEMSKFEPKDKWVRVDVPHNWDQYEGYRRLRHGNRHGYAYYLKYFDIRQQPKGKRAFLYFEGVGSYATVWLNEKLVGYHAGGRTTFTLDVTNNLKFNGRNILAVRADHPANIHDLPWACGGCSDERGFSEGSQPMGIFRPVHLVITENVRVEPFGVHIWNDTAVTKRAAQIFVETEIKNYGSTDQKVVVSSRLLDRNGIAVSQASSSELLKAGGNRVIKQKPPPINDARLWSLDDPYLYTLVTEVSSGGRVVDRTETPYGIRWISWPIGNGSKQFLLNGRPVFINGIAEYEHLLGDSHAFTEEQVRTRVMEVRAAGFNAFRDAHHPHNLRYQKYWDSLGMLWWAQMGAHIWYDSPEFRNNFKTLLRDWVKERRNSPSLVLWGLQNESKLPEDFARECANIIRELDPTASSQRLVTTCNGGSGTDWDVPQNWTGTYGGNPATYSDDLKKQILVGEYGAWRTLGLHSEDNSYKSNIYSEERISEMLEMKMRLGNLSKDSAAGHFMWLLSSHDNPGRVQSGEGYRELDRVGPVNYKGLLTPWEQPLDVYYMYRSNYASKEKEPMVYIDSHTWPSRWTAAGSRSDIIVYSNCDEVELFNDVRANSLGRKKKAGIGSHFQWNNIEIKYNVLYAIGYVNGKEAAKDYIVLNHLPAAPNFNQFFKNAKRITKPQPGYNYLYRVNCGGGNYIDENGNTWLADRVTTDDKTWGSESWTADFKGMPPFFASQQRTFDPINGTRDWKLFQTFRYGREKLSYRFPVQDGEYLIELYFTEPWLGTGGGMDCQGWRMFDVAVNGRTVLKNVDIWKEVGHDGALKKIVKAKILDGEIVISFPHVASGQAVISAIAIASANKAQKPSAPAPALFESTTRSSVVEDWLDLGDKQFVDKGISFSSLPPELFGAEWLKTTWPTNKGQTQTVKMLGDADIFVGIDTVSKTPLWLNNFSSTMSFVQNDAGITYRVYEKKFPKGAVLDISGQGISGNSNCLIMAQPISNIEPAYDLKTAASYKAVNAQWNGPGIVKAQIEGKDRVLFKNPSAENVLEWSFSVGVADKYSLTISYNNPGTESIKGTLQLSSADGTLLREEEVFFTPTKQGKLNYIEANTGTMINAGNYQLKLTSPNAAGVSINSLDVQ